jgi:sugar phosphate isomerase/epimerase
MKPYCPISPEDAALLQKPMTGAPIAPEQSHLGVQTVEQIDALYEEHQSVLQIPGLEKVLRVITEPGVETGQPFGAMAEANDPGLAMMRFARNAGAARVMICDGMMLKSINPENLFDINFHTPEEIAAWEAATGCKRGPISAHCMAYVHATVGIPGGLDLVLPMIGNPHVRAEIFRLCEEESVQAAQEFVQAWSERYLLNLIDAAADAGIMILGWFWGLGGHAITAQGFDWPFGIPHLYMHALRRSVAISQPLRDKARERGVYLAQEIHNGTGIFTARQFTRFLVACGYDPVITVWGDPSHCDEGEDWRRRFIECSAVRNRLVGTHIKNMIVLPGHPIRENLTNWRERPKQFCAHGEGIVNLVSYTKALIAAGVGARYAAIMGFVDKDGTGWFTLHSEAEDSTEALVTDEEVVFAIYSGNDEEGLREAADQSRGACSNGIRWVKNNLRIVEATAAFTDTMAGGDVAKQA